LRIMSLLWIILSVVMYFLCLSRALSMIVHHFLFDANDISLCLMASMIAFYSSSLLFFCSRCLALFLYSVTEFWSSMTILLQEISDIIFSSFSLYSSISLGSFTSLDILIIFLIFYSILKSLVKILL